MVDDELVSRIERSLREHGQYREVIAGNEDQVDAVRAAGRRAGRSLGWRVRTLRVENHDVSTGAAVVFVVVTESTPLQDEVFRVRRQGLMRDLIRKLGE